MKKPKAVVNAEAALAFAARDVAAAKEKLKQLEGAYHEAYAAVRQAQMKADEGLPQCRLVHVHWRTGKEEGGANHVIVRRTPGGMLVVRRVGEPIDRESKFKWAEHSGVFRQVEKSSFSSCRELRDVPAEYLPAGAGQVQK